VEINPNSKIPAARDYDGPGGKPIDLFESGSIVLYLAEKYGRFIPSDPALKVEVMNWVFWQVFLNEITFTYFSLF
jgi:GST-like protein